MSNNIYDILGKLKGLLPTETPVETAKEPVYENVEPRGDIMEAVKSLEEKYMSFKEDAKPDFLDLDKDGDTDEPMKSAAKSAKDDEPAKPDSDAVAKRKRLQALKDKQEDERAEKGDDYKSATRFVKGRAYGGSAQKDDEEKELDEVAPPGDKAERMVKHIKKGYSKDGKLTPKEKGIAYATAWKAHNKGQVEEATEFGDTIENSKADLTKVKLEESAMMEASSYTYEKVADILAAEQPHLDANGDEFKKACYDQLIKMHLSPKSARWNVYYDEDFLSDCATAYSHNLKHGKEHEPVLDAVQELDEIARLAGLPTKKEATCEGCGCEESMCECGTMEESELGAIAGGVAGAVLGKSPMAASMGSQIGDKLTSESDEIDEAATRKDFRQVADLIKQIPDAEKRKELAHHHSAIFKQQNPRFKHDVFCKACGLDESDMAPAAVIVGEEEMDEGNEFTKARLDAIAQGKDTFTVGGKVHKVTGDTSQEKHQVESTEAVTEDININVTANGEEDVVNLIRKLSGMPVVAVQATPELAVAEEVVEEERDIEWDNTPSEQTAPLSAAIPSGNDLHKSKIQDPQTANKAANPLKKEEELEESLWQSYESMIKDVKA